MDEIFNNYLALPLPLGRQLSQQSEPALSPCKLPRAIVSKKTNSPKVTWHLSGDHNVENLERLRAIVWMGIKESSFSHGS